MKTTLVILGLVIGISVLAQPAHKGLIQLRYEENYSPTYYEIIDYYKLLDEHYPNAKLIEIGLTDSGKPLHLFVITNDGDFDPVSIRKKDKQVLLINNGIHPGEPEGIDASIQFADELLANKKLQDKLLKGTVICIIPVYNIGGCLDRSQYNRTGQTTPLETGFRGNAANLDLNRDFTKCDSENARSFTRMFQEWKPEVMLDTHTTNGSDHQYSITMISPPYTRFPENQHNYLTQKLIPSLYGQMKKGKYELIPYIDYMFGDPRQGIKMTLELPRYSIGYLSMFHCYGMITENQIYHRFPDRVKSCLQFMYALAEYTADNGKEIAASIQKGIQTDRAQTEHVISYKLDSARYEEIEFKGYENSDTILDRVTLLRRFGYDRTKPYTTKIKYYNQYLPDEKITVPEFYVLPQAWKDAVDRLKLNKVEMQRLKNDTTMTVEMYYIESFTSPERPYNGHYYHEKVELRSEKQNIRFYSGDYLVPVRQERINYIVEMLEPKAPDSFFRWNFFDQVLDSREYFSNYGFEQNALKYLNEHPEFRKKFEEKRKADPEFAKNHRAQLSYIYYNTEWNEDSYKRYPVGRIYR